MTDADPSESTTQRRGCGFTSILGLLALGLVALLVLLGSLDPDGVSDAAPAAPSGPKVGIIAGHWQYDSGAVCGDGLQEVELNKAIAEKVITILAAKGYRAEMLAEYDSRLRGYQAEAVVSVHCDSCTSQLSGFKVARLTNSAVPEQEDRLVESLYEAYGASTGLPPHLDTITDDMRYYHAFYEIAAKTPGAIIECGFMGGDRYLLSNQQDRVAQGIANGIIAFLGAP